VSKVQTLADFYKSHEWRSIRQSLMIQRSHPAKGLLCEHCKEVILKDIDCIAHHIKELTPSNVHDATIESRQYPIGSSSMSQCHP